MKSPFRLLLVVSAILSLANCDKPMPPAAAAPVTEEADSQLAEARDALQRQALEIETKTALMDKQLAEMAQSLKDRDNAELRSSLDALKRQNEELRVQADAARQQSNAITQRIVVTPQPNVVPQPMALPDYSLFYDRLTPFGRWFEVNGYGYCWRPTITVAGWRPYVDGCWVWSSLGWAWQSNEPFGWATYHYGRWVNLARYGWVWVPGSDWAPAWVAWRQSRDCVGWAPLPPEQGVCSGVYRDCDSRYGLGPSSYTFINTNQFVSSSYINVYAPVTRQTTIFQHSVNVTQIVPSHSRGHAFVHQGGPPRSQMEQACGQPVPQRQVQSMHADQMPVRQQPHGRRDATAPVAMVELPAVSPGGHMRRPEIKEHIQKPVLMGGFEGVPQQAARQIRENIDREKETAAVQQQPTHGRTPHQSGRHPTAAPVVVNGAPAVPSTPPQETVRPAVAAETPVPAQSAAPVVPTGVQQQPGQGNMPHPFPRRSAEAEVTANMPALPNAPAQETVRPAVAAEPGSAREPRRHGQSGVRDPQAPNVPPDSKVVETSAPAAAPSVPAVMPAVVENKAPEPSATPGVPVSASESTPPAAVNAPPAAMPQPTEPVVSPPPVAAEKMAAEAEKARMHAGRERGHAAAMEQRQQQEMQERGLAEKKAAEQAVMNAEAEKSRMQAAAAQQEAVAAQQQRMAADQAAAEAEKARQQAAATAAQQQQEMAAQQQRATAERMASEQAAAAEAERVRQQTEAAAMQQRQQEEAARRTAEEQQMKTQQETERRTQEMAQRQAEEQARRQQEAEMQRAQEQARRAAEEQQMRAQQEAAQREQEMEQRRAEEQVRRQQEAEMQRAQEQARRAAEEQQMRAQQEAAQRAQEMAQRQAEEQARRQQEAAQRAQEMAQRQAEEQARRAQEMAQRQAEEQARRAQEEAQRAAAEAAQRAAVEAAQRAAAEAARNQPQPAPGS
ncbi:DUF6600 domain-containing protein [Prosthecobacter sp.]|uniref:DUF6600 domain-containing protein n=1 Tax=Prosthecobacter sp. TaxID=1965333 RepID=UPI003783EE1C